MLTRSSGDEIQRVLVVTAHPDDVDFGAAGTVRTLIEGGASVSYCIVTNGDAGGSDRTVSRDQIPAIRQAEQRAAAAVLGVHDVRFLGYVDGDLELTKPLRRDISRVIREVKPDLVLTQSPERNMKRIFASHPDHMTAGEAALRAVYPDARNPFAHPELLEDEGLEPWSVAEVWLFGTPSPDRFTDITDHLELKLQAISSHASQLEETTPEDLRGRILMWGGMMASMAGLEDGRLAEAFQTVPTS